MAAHGEATGLWQTSSRTFMIVVDHTAFPTERTDEYFENWKKGVAIAATCDNIRWKISGLGMADHNWTIDSIRPYVLTSIETMGVERCFFATNWPVDWLFSTYDEVIDAYTEIISGLQPGRADRPILQDRRGPIPHLTAASWPSPVVPDLIRNPGVVGHAFSATLAASGRR